MFDVVFNMLNAHELWIVAAALLLGSMTAVTVVLTARRAFEVEHGKLGWIAAASLVASLGGWGMGLMMLLAYTPSFPVTIDVVQTFSSLGMLAFTCSGCIYYLIKDLQRNSVWVVGGLAALGIYISSGMMVTALDGPVGSGWNGDRLALSLSVGAPFIMFGSYALREINGRIGAVLASLGISIGVFSFHFITLSSLEIPAELVPGFGKPTTASPLVAVSIMLGLVPLLSLAFFSAVFDRSIRARRKAEEARLRTLANATSEGLAILDGQQIIEINHQLAELVGLKASDLIGAPICKLACDEASVQAIREITEGEQRTCRLRSVRGPDITAQITIRSIEYQGELVEMLAFRDVSSEERARARMLHMAHHDTLTGLPNRLAFRERLEQELERSWKEHTQVALMFFDLDRFKEVNDVHGHATGDALLVAVAERMLDALPKQAIAARLSGDEFAVILPDVQTRLDALTTAERVVDSVGSPVTLGSVHINVSASGGVTLFPLDGEDMDRLMNQADLALYRAKHQGRNCVCEFDPQMGRQLQERRELEADLAVAIEDELLDLHFQPQAAIGSGEIVGFEALVRWNDDKRGYVPPAEFVQLAEESGQILKLGRWVIERACREAVKWPASVGVSVNVSPAQFRQGNVILTIERALKATGLDPARLEIEITEGVLIDDESRALLLLSRLKDLGVGLAIDDFGTGYASLNYLRAFPFDKIKIDRAFMSGIQNQPDAQIIVRSTIDLAHRLGMKVVVEGIEEFEELVALGHYPEVVLQGYLLSRPITRGQIPAFLEQRPDFLDQMQGQSPRRLG